MKSILFLVILACLCFAGASGKKILHRHNSHTSDITKLLDGILKKIAADEKSAKSSLDSVFAALDSDSSDRASDVTAQKGKISSKEAVIASRTAELNSLVADKNTLQKRNDKADKKSNAAKASEQKKYEAIVSDFEKEKELVASIKRLLGAHITDGQTKQGPAKSCAHAQSQISNAKTGKYWIKTKSMKKAYKIKCDMARRGGGWAVVTHKGLDSMSGSIHGYEKPGSWKRSTNYDLPDSVVKQMLKDSEDHEQYLDKRCKGSGIWPAKSSYSFWKTMGGRVVKDNWPNHSTCDKNDGTWRKSAGWITKKNDLPIKKIFIGDTGDGNEYAKIQVGPLYLR